METEENKKPSNPDAFPFIGANGVHYSGMTLMTYSAIHLKQPISEFEWLNTAIMKTKKDEFAAKAMESMLNALYIKGELSTPEEMIEKMKLIPVNSYWFADSMLKQREL